MSKSELPESVEKAIYEFAEQCMEWGAEGRQVLEGAAEQDADRLRAAILAAIEEAEKRGYKRGATDVSDHEPIRRYEQERDEARRLHDEHCNRACQLEGPR